MLALVLLLLCGCSSADVDHTGGTSATGTDVYHQKLMERLAQYEFTPPYEGDPWIEHDPDRRVYIALGNMYLDLYPDTGGGMNPLAFWMISLDPFDKSEIQVEIPIQTEYTVSVLDASPMCHEAANGDFTLKEWQYLCMIGLDFQERERQTQYATVCVELLQEYRDKYLEEKKTHEGIEDSEEYQFYYNKQLEYQAKYMEPSEQYKALTKEELPKFYAYRVSIQLTGLGSHEETVESLAVTVGQERYEVDIGQWRLHTQAPQQFLDWASQNGHREITVGGSGATSSGYVPGPYGYYSFSFSFVAKDDITVTGIHPLTTHSDPAKIQGGYVQVSELVDGKEVLVLDYLWDTESPLTFEDGQIVRIRVAAQDDRLKAYYVGFYNGLFLDYTYRGKAYTALAENRQYRLGDLWDLYLMVFEGVDVGEGYYYYLGRDDRPDWLRYGSNAE